ncbi:MAG: hypothetical protein PVG90_12220 [Bacillota bacterium]|jgi:hypothetical protein
MTQEEFVTQVRSFVRRLFMRPFASLDEALAQAFGELGGDAKVLLMPYGGSTLPVVAK